MTLETKDQGENPYVAPCDEREGHPDHPVRRILRQIAGWTLLILGVVGLALPVLQGILFIVMGAILLAPDIPLFRRLLIRVERKVPRLRSMIRKARGGRRGRRRLRARRGV